MLTTSEATALREIREAVTLLRAEVFQLRREIRELPVAAFWAVAGWVIADWLQKRLGGWAAVGALVCGAIGWFWWSYRKAKKEGKTNAN